MTDYRLSHLAPGSDDPTICELGQVWPEDVLDQPEWYCNREELGAVDVLRNCQNDPDRPVSVFRAVPPGTNWINAGDWVALDVEWARNHAIQDDDEGNDWPVISVVVKARYVNTDGSSLAEFGYNGPSVQASIVK
ncbi:MAG: hypothetical protein WAX14_23110 [Rhodococcus sp. (in: high G+C Gram-positive bacteria)]|uniref:hypothetical protein n=1 Tax=Rhodococcus sp. TaxID=1831 RepID=UPI003BB5F1B4